MNAEEQASLLRKIREVNEIWKGIAKAFGEKELEFITPEKAAEMVDRVRNLVRDAESLRAQKQVLLERLGQNAS